MSKIITPRLLKSWGACSEGYEGFCRLFPEGADLKTATDGLIADGHMSWAEWLFNHARSSGDFAAETAEGFLNTGDQNTGDQNTGHRNTGDQNTGHRNTGHRNTGHLNT
ncbi:pentapeptide repeat-containing protein, partial [Mesorhizobium sp. B2-3-10]|uniref:pentapeptide repeat-containing protein n=1 Tax=Mesorhizobium sp. B2-3-10 TaxID=2589954 RepID=UPI00116715D0